MIVLNEVNKIVRDRDGELLNYFMFRHIIWYLLFSGRDASSKRFMEEYRRLFKWLDESGYRNKTSLFSNKIKSEPFQNRVFISIFYRLHKLGLVGVFSKIYCKG